MVYSGDGMQPDPDKTDALNFITAPTNKDSVWCMMQSNLDFILNFAQKAAPLRELTHHNIYFNWKPIHKICCENLIQDFQKDLLLWYYDMRKKIFVITDTHIFGLGAILSLKEMILIQQDDSLLRQEQPQKQRVDIHNLIWKQLQ